MKKIIFIWLLVFISCNEKADEKSINEKPEEILETIPDLSVFHLPAEWTTQFNENLQWKDLKGNVLVMVMVYTSCKAACPRLVADMKQIAAQIPEVELNETKFVLVTIDPENDTVQDLQEFAREYELEQDHWLLLRGSIEDTREFATVLAVNYKKISPIDFTHSNIISVFDKQGVLVHQTEGLGIDTKETVNAIRKNL